MCVRVIFQEVYVYIYVLIPRNNLNKYVGLEHWDIEREIKDSPWLHTQKEHIQKQAQLSIIFKAPHYRVCLSMFSFSPNPDSHPFCENAIHIKFLCP